MVVHFQKKYVSNGGSCPNNICALVVNQFINMYVHYGSVSEIMFIK